MKQNVAFFVNGELREAEVEKNWTLLHLLREVWGLTGAKCGCGAGDCGACRVIIDGEAVNSCVVPAYKVDGKQVETIEGVAKNGVLHPLQQAFIDCGAIQCGYCTPGMIMSALALLRKNPDPTETEIREALRYNICRCTGYVKIVDAIQSAAKTMRGER